MVGRERRHGVSASSNTEDRFERLRRSESLARIGVRNLIKRSQPRYLKDELSSSIKDNIGGIKK